MLSPRISAIAVAMLAATLTVGASKTAEAHFFVASPLDATTDVVAIHATRCWRQSGPRGPGWYRCVGHHRHWSRRGGGVPAVDLGMTKPVDLGVAPIGEAERNAERAGNKAVPARSPRRLIGSGPPPPQVAPLSGRNSSGGLSSGTPLSNPSLSRSGIGTGPSTSPLGASPSPSGSSSGGGSSSAGSVGGH
jgi:hypothetical protein